MKKYIKYIIYLGALVLAILAAIFVADKEADAGAPDNTDCWFGIPVCMGWDNKPNRHCHSWQCWEIEGGDSGDDGGGFYEEYQRQD